jgi:hypothetical protein
MPKLAIIRGVGGATVLALLFVLATATPAAALPDFDGDGFLAPADCSPLDPAVAPGKADLPDLTFEDTNCDGIDGDIAKAVFVSGSTGDDAFSGTKDFPKKTINAAVTVAKAAGKDVYATAGPYNELVDAETGVGIYGGYVPVTFARTRSEATAITAAPQAVLADNDQGVVLQLLTLNGVAPLGSGQSAYGLRAINGARIALRGVTSNGGDARTGPVGTSFSRPATPLRPDSGQCGSDFASRGPRGTGGNLGGLGGEGGFGDAVSGTSGTGGLGPSGGSLGPAGGVNENGDPGGGATAPGAFNGHGGNATFSLTSAGATWAGSSNSTGGSDGSAGSGGGGGGGSGGAFADLGIIEIRADGAGGGGGGGGGFGGAGGTRGLSGGGSFGAYLADATLVAAESTLTGGKGGNGGNGGNGAPGGFGGPGGFGAIFCGTSAFVFLEGGDGGNGSAGGNGGNGGGGAGGPSAGVFRTGAGAVYTSLGSSETASAASAGGTRGTGGPAAPAGQSLGVMSAPSATGTTADFDGDGKTDAADGCPEIAADAANGCPDRPPKLPDGDLDNIPDGADACPAAPAGISDANEDGCADPPPSGGTLGGSSDPERVLVVLSFRFRAFSRHTVLSKLQVKNVPFGSTLVATCALGKKKCPKKLAKRFTKNNAFGTIALKRYLERRLKVGTTIVVTVTKPGFIGAVKVMKIRKAKAPLVSTRCLPPGARESVACT